MELSVLQGMAAYPEFLESARHRLGPEAFRFLSNPHAFAALVSMERPSIAGLADAGFDLGIAEEGYPDYLPHEFEANVEALALHALRTKVLDKLAAAQHKLEEGEPLEAVLEEVHAVNVPPKKEGRQTLAELARVIISPVVAELTQPLSLGFHELDRMMNGGLPAKRTMIVAGRPGRGKSSLVKDMGINVAKAGSRVLIATTEMDRKDFTMRALSSMSGVPFWRIVEHQLDDTDKVRLEQAAARYGGLALEIAEVNTLSETLAEARAFKPDLLVLDFLQTLSVSDDSRAGGDANRNAELSFITRELRAWARSSGGRVISASQLSRDSSRSSGSGKAGEDAAPESEPGLGHLRDSGSLEQNTDYVLLLWKPSRDSFSAKLEKNKDGKLGYLERLEFMAPTMTWTQGGGR